MIREIKRYRVISKKKYKLLAGFMAIFLEL